jgi:hypothetical protein
MLGRDAYTIWDTTITKRIRELQVWRKFGEDTSFAGAELVDIQL